MLLYELFWIYLILIELQENKSTKSSIQKIEKMEEKEIMNSYNKIRREVCGKGIYWYLFKNFDENWFKIQVGKYEELNS